MLTSFFPMRRLAALLLAALLVAPGCDLFEPENPVDPNGPSLDGILQDATQSQIRDLAVGVQAASRIDIDLYLIDVGVIGREYYRFSSADPRFTSELLGQGAAVLDDNTFYTTRPWGARYRAVRNACTMLQALDVTTAVLTDAEKAAARGFANTWIVYQLLLNSNLTYNNGVRIDVCEIRDDAPLVAPRAAVLDVLATMLDEAAQDLSQDAGEDFFFPVVLGSDLFSGAMPTVDAFLLVNRALAARVDAYREDWSGVLDALGNSFIDASASLELGAYHLFSTGAGDLTNPFFLDPQNPETNAIVAHPSYIGDLEEGDNRASKVVLRVDEDGAPNPAEDNDLTGAYGVNVYPSPVSPIPIITNGDLLLLRAEANIQLGNLGTAVDDLDVIRNAAGLDGYSGDVSQAALIDEMLHQRRYELYGEGHRWVDIRRYDRLDTLPIDRAGDDVFVQFPIPQNENVGGGT